MLEKILLLIGDAATGQDDLIELLIKQAKDFVIMYCGLSEYDSKFDSIVMKMVVEDWNRRGSEGLASRSFSGISESYNEEPYSSVIMTSLKKLNKGGIRFL
jgi:hypothetical protein